MSIFQVAFRSGQIFLALACLTVQASAAPERLPDGKTATADGAGIQKAWYTHPTTRYAHAVLGDAIEAGGLRVEDASGRAYQYLLADHMVFEDITPRLRDLDGDGQAEVITIRADMRQGAAVVVYGLRDGQLVELAATPPIGRANRWLSIAAIEDFTGSGKPTIAIVRTPHIGGILDLVAYRNGRLVSLIPPTRGVSTHVIGSREISLALAHDVTGDGVAELILPDQSLRRLIVFSFRDGVKERFKTALPARVASKPRWTGGQVSVPLTNGERVLFSTAELGG